MRHNFELFQDFIGLDMMKRGINTLLWPYFLMAMYDEMKKVCIRCEGILCGEQEDMYQFACNFMAENAPGRPLSGCDFVRQTENSNIAKTGCSSIRSSNRDFVYTNKGTDSRNCPFSVLYSFWAITNRQTEGAVRTPQNE